MTRKMAVIFMLLALAGAGLAVVPGLAQAGKSPPVRIEGAATTMLEGGTGAPDFVPVLTKLAFHWNGQQGRLECLALAPHAPAGEPQSGEFDVNAMYVTGPVTEARIGESRAVLRGVSTVTGLGAGEDVPFRLTVQPGGPGTSLVLEVSGLVFREIILEGEIRFA